MIMEVSIMIMFIVILFAIYIGNNFMCSQSESILETICYSILIGGLLFFTLSCYTTFLFDYATQKTIVEIENKEIKYEVTSIEPNTGKVLTIKLLDE